MNSCEFKFMNNMFENIIVTSMHNIYNEDIYDKCFMDISTSDHFVDFYLNYLHASLVTSICDSKDHRGVSNKQVAELRKYKYNALNQVDNLIYDLDEQIGAFKGQYDIVVAFDILNYYTNNHLWQMVVENILFYLKPGGLCFINGAFDDNKVIKYGQNFRSNGVWRALVNKCGCSIVSIEESPSTIFCKNNKVMVIHK